MMVRMENIRRAVPVLAALLLLTACGEAPRSFQGYVEGEFVRIGPDEPGRLIDLDVHRGQTVDEGARLFVLDARTFRADRDAAAAQLKEAEASLANLLAQQQRPEEIDVLLARKDRAEADLRLAAAELERQRKLYKDGFTAKARLDDASAAYERAKAGLAEIRRQIDTGRLTARVHQIEQARAAVNSARAALSAAEERLARRTVNAPEGGVIQDVFFYPGEVVPAGRPVVSLLPPERRKIVFYVDEPARALFKPGSRISVTCDSCPDDLAATVKWLSAKEEYTPPVIFSPEERAKLVFRIEARPDRPLALAPGQPVTVTLQGTQDSAGSSP